MVGAPVSTPDTALDALFLPISDGPLRLPADGSVLFLRARDGYRLREMAQAGWLCEQSFKPFAEALMRSGLKLGEALPGERFKLVLVLPPRQRDEARALFARAALHAEGGGAVLACVPNAEGAKSAQADLQALLGTVSHLSKHKCRVFWGTSQTAALDRSRVEAWLALDQPRENAAGYLSRPGLFAWDRVDTASALLAANLPDDLHGQVADLGAGYGYLAAQMIARCPRIERVDLYEAEARALESARLNVQRAMAESGRELAFALYWHDVTMGIERRYDTIVSNPPFHQGRADLPELGRAFIAQAADALLPHGRLWLVANRHLPYESTLAAHFQQIRTVALQDGFKVIEAKGLRK
ncbi:class I SAM-dependent methyltransferase [Dyella mobilis]|uniref:Class I SAM-dependent methyltransferase n=1 Tax=Dyella mobilis TaxID=1849582 RepID=A0ABS2KLF4_9GAMM|nr:methyltransferase [Dyella mobilis]MBM7131770.1 class I SAM-dependent methyltransferase [Dyella mobilis]GLQ96251.1 16S rRNA methyltransferase [Dyella mobilis]